MAVLVGDGRRRLGGGVWHLYLTIVKERQVRAAGQVTED